MSSEAPRGSAGATPVETEPDYRMSLAAERTYLAYTRTALALLVGGVAVVSALPDAPHLALRRGIGVLVILLGLGVGGSAHARWRQVDRAMRRGLPLPRSRLAVPLTIGVSVAAALCLLLVLLPA